MLVDGLRPLWLPALARANPNVGGRISEWVNHGQYYFDSPVKSKSATFVLKPGSDLTDIFAAEMSRFASAAIETSAGITRAKIAKSTAWLFIQTYYAAFYAAHSILRSAGLSASTFRPSDCRKADAVAALLGFAHEPLDAAQFECLYVPGSGRLECRKAIGKGVHEQFWRIFDLFIRNVSASVLRNPALAQADAQQIFRTLIDLTSILTSYSYNSGNWLSAIRNEVTYTQQHSAWFPYGRTVAECNKLFALQRQWHREPDRISLNLIGLEDSERFVTACTFLVSLALAVVRDMAARSPSKESFLTAGPLKLLHQVSS